MKKTSNNLACCLGIFPHIPKDTNELLLFLRDLAISAPEAGLLARTLPSQEADPIVKDYVRNHFGEEGT